VVTAAGTFVIQYGGTFEIWGAAELYFDGGAIPFLQDAGIETDAEIFLRINTGYRQQPRHQFSTCPRPAVRPASSPAKAFTLQPGSFGLYLAGTLSLDKGPVDFALDGVFDIDFIYNGGDWTFDIFAFAQLNLAVSNVRSSRSTRWVCSRSTIPALPPCCRFRMAAAIPLSSSSTASYALLNTTGQQVVYTLPSDLTAILNQLPVSNGTLLSAMETEFNNLATMYPGYVTASGSGASAMLSITIPAACRSSARAGPSPARMPPARIW